MELKINTLQLLSYVFTYNNKICFLVKLGLGCVLTPIRQYRYKIETNEYMVVKPNLKRFETSTEQLLNN